VPRDSLLNPPCGWFGCALLAGVLLSGCGGGGSPEPSSGMNASPLLETALLLPTSYTLRAIPVPPERLTLVFGENRPRTINRAGQLIASDDMPGTNVRRPFVYDSATDTLTYLAPESDPTQYVPTAINDSGEVAGFVPGNGFFTWSRSAGVATTPVQGVANWVYISEAGRIGGEVDLGQACGGFDWDTSTRTLREYPTFCPIWMNAAGVLAGRVGNEIATVGADSVVRLVDPALPPGQSRVITDDNRLFVDLFEDAGDLRAGAAVIANGTATNIGLGAAVAPPGEVPEREIAFLTRVRSNGQAIGGDTLFLRAPSTAPPNCLGETVSALFYWSAESGTVPITFGERTLTLHDINEGGIVVGDSLAGSAANPTDRRAFVWTREGGAVLLDTLVSNLPANTVLVDALQVGDGGHIVVALAGPGEPFTFLGYVVLIPQS